MAQDKETYPDQIDISNCDKEHVDIIGKSQAHGVLLDCIRKVYHYPGRGKFLLILWKGLPGNSWYACMLSY